MRCKNVECVHHFTTGSNGPEGGGGDYEYGNELSGYKHEEEVSCVTHRRFIAT